MSDYPAVDVAAVAAAFRAATTAALAKPALSAREVDVLCGGQLNADALVARIAAGPVRHVDVLELAAALRRHPGAKGLRHVPCVENVLAIDRAHRAQSARDNAQLAKELGPLFCD